MSRKKTKSELLIEYLEKGGKIEKIESVKPEDKGPTIRSTVSKPPTLYNLVNGAHYFADNSRRRKTTKKKIDVNLDVFPEELRAKLGTFAPKDEEDKGDK